MSLSRAVLTATQRAVAGLLGIPGVKPNGELIAPDGTVVGLTGAKIQALNAQRVKIAVGVIGQSNERGQVDGSDEAAFPQAFKSLRNPAFSMPLAGTITSSAFSGTTRRRGGWWPKLYDDLYDWGYDTLFYSSALGSASLPQHYCGQVKVRTNSTGYAQRRSSMASGDRGYAGDMIVQGGKVFLCTTGNLRFGYTENPWYMPGTALSNLDFIATSGSLTTAASLPDFTAAAIGATVTDGAIVWTRIADVGFSDNQTLSESQTNFGFDPLGALQRLHIEMQRIQGVTDKYILICNGQADTGVNNLNYQAALQNIARYYLSRGYKVVIGLSSYFYNGAGVGQSTFSYEELSLGRTNALAALKTEWGTTKVFDGANLYTDMGTSILTKLQADQVHLNASGAIEAGGYWSAKFKAFLPQVTI